MSKYTLGYRRVSFLKSRASREPQLTFQKLFSGIRFFMTRLDGKYYRKSRKPYLPGPLELKCFEDLRVLELYNRIDDPGLSRLKNLKIIRIYNVRSQGNWWNLKIPCSVQDIEVWNSDITCSFGNIFTANSVQIYVGIFQYY